MNAQEIKNILENKENTNCWGFTTLPRNFIEEVVKNDFVKVHGFSLNTSDDYQECANDKDFVHFVEDVNGYIQGVNVHYRSTHDCPCVEKIQH